MAYALADKTVKRVVAMAADANGGQAPVPNYKAKIDIADLIAEEKARNAKRIDGKFNLAKLAVVATSEKGIGLVGDYEEFQTPRALNEMAEYQLATRMGVPSGFFGKCSSDLKLRIVKEHGGPFRPEGASDHPDKETFLRINDDGRVRAILSPGYALLDNIAVLEATMKLFAASGATAAYLNLGDTFFHGRVLFPSHEQTLGKGDRLVPGAQLRNSEVGLSSLSWAPALFKVQCWNGIISATGDGDGHTMHQRHTGKASAEVFANLDKAMSEIIAGLPKQMERVQRASTVKIPDAQEYLENSVRHGLPKTSIPTILEAAKEADATTAWDLINTVTATAQGLGLDHRIAFEKAAGKMLAAIKVGK